MARNDVEKFEFRGGPLDGEVLSVADDGDGMPELLVLPHSGEEHLPIREQDPASWSEYRYERDGDVYRYLGPADP